MKQQLPPTVMHSNARSELNIALCSTHTSPQVEVAGGDLAGLEGVVEEVLPGEGLLRVKPLLEGMEELLELRVDEVMKSFKVCCRSWGLA